MARAIWVGGLMAGCVALAGCTTEVIQMRNPTTGQVATCGNHSLAFPIYATIASTHDQSVSRIIRSRGMSARL